MTTTSANVQPTPPGRAYWLLSTLVLPIVGVLAVLLLHRTPSGLADHGLPLVAVVAIVASVTSAVIWSLPRLQAMPQRRRVAYTAVSTLLQVGLGFAYGCATVVVALVIACQNSGCMD
jgi:hypothetical protein